MHNKRQNIRPVPSGVTLYDRDSLALVDAEYTDSDLQLIERMSIDFERRQLRQLKAQESLGVKYVPGMTTVVEPVNESASEAIPIAQKLGAAAIKEHWAADFVIIDTSVSSAYKQSDRRDRRMLRNMKDAGLFNMAFLITEDPESTPTVITRRTNQMYAFIASQLDVPALEIATFEVGPSYFEEAQFLIQEARDQGIIAANGNGTLLDLN